MNKISYILLTTLFLASCTNSLDPENCIDGICVDDEWIWVESYGSIAGVTITPQTEMMSRSLIIDETHYREFEDGQLVLNTEYEYLKSNELEVFTNDSLIIKLSSGNWYAVFEEDNNLILLEPCADCWRHTYQRK